MGVPLYGAFLCFLVTTVRGYSEPCPKKCTCKMSSLECRGINAVDWHDVLLFLSAPDATTILNVTVTNSDVTTLAYFPQHQNLEYLDLSNCTLKQIDFNPEYRFPNMRTLILANNIIEMLNERCFSPFPNLEELSLRNNYIPKLDYEYLRLVKMKKFDVSRNKITQLHGTVFRLLSSVENLDLSHNLLTRAQSSNFYTLQRLRFLNLSHNHITHFDYDTFATNVRIESLDLSYNQLYLSPGADLKQMLSLVALNISGNPISTLSAWELEFDRLQVFSASNCANLSVIEAGAFSKSRDLRYVDLSNNHRLTYISPSAFENCTLIHSLDLRNCSLPILFSSILRGVAQVSLSGNRFVCECMAAEVDKIDSTTVVDWDSAECAPEDAPYSILKLSNARVGNCPARAILPMGDTVTANIGSTTYLYCGARNEQDSVVWKMPNGSTIVGEDPLHFPRQTTLDIIRTRDEFMNRAHSVKVSEKHINGNPQSGSQMDYFSNSLYHPESHFVSPRPRVHASKELLRIDVVGDWDGGLYTCTVKRGKSIDQSTIELIVKDVPIGIQTNGHGSHYISLVWNDTLTINAVDRVAMFLRITDAQGNKRPTQLSLHNPWTTYNVLRLRANTNYTICLEYSLADEPNMILTSTCAEGATLPVQSFFSSFSTSTTICFFSVVFLILGCLVLRCVCMRLHIWQETKYRSRLNQSISGQSFISQSSAGASMTYENQQLHLCRVPSSSSESQSTEATHTLLTSDVSV